MAEKAHGIWTQPLQAANWSGVIGASLAPKSTVRPVIAAMPAPLPTAAVVDVGGAVVGRPLRDSGATNVLPAPLSDAFLADAPARPVNAASATAATPSTTRTAARLRLRFKVFLLS